MPPLASPLPYAGGSAFWLRNADLPGFIARLLGRAFAAVAKPTALHHGGITWTLLLPDPVPGRG